MMSFVYVALGGAIGAALRHGVNLVSLRLSGTAFPIATLVVNVVGSLAMGLFVGWLAKRAGLSLWGLSAADLRVLVATGVLGGFTTFSAFSLDVAVLFERGAMASAIGYVIASIALSIGAVFWGLSLARGM